MKSLLVVDDSAMMRMIIKNAVAGNGFVIAGEANNGQAGVDKFFELRPDIVTMDVTMNHLNGLEALRKIMKISADAKVIMVSAMGQELIVKDAILSGAKGFIVKPFSAGQLLEALNKALGIKKH